MGMRRIAEWRLPGFLYPDDLVLCGKSEEDQNVMLGCFVEVCRRGLKVNVDQKGDGVR